MTYEQAVDYWFGLVNYEKSTPQPDDLKLDRMRALMDRLGNPEQRLRIVHVAGSKGKGSTAAMLATVLQKAGHVTGLFTSPHLCDVEERIQIDRVSVGRRELTELVETVRNASAMISGAPTFFEVATAMAFVHFARREVDVAVLEVGLGGRFDSTNVCMPLVSVITSISLDHTQQLGDRLANIAMEKAGIIKPGRVVVSGVTATEARTVIDVISRERNAPLRQLNTDFHFEYEPGIVIAKQADFYKKPKVWITTQSKVWQETELGLLGEHQGANAAVVVETVETLQRQAFVIEERAVVAGLANVQWPARLEVAKTCPLVVLDCAHNVASIQALVDTLTTSFPPARRLLVFAVSADKDISGMLSLLAPHFDHAYFTSSSNRRSAPPSELAGLCAKVGGPPSTVCRTSKGAWQAVSAAAGPDDLICIAGSVFLAGDLRPVIVEP